MRRSAGYTWTDYKRNTQITKELKIIPILDKLLEYQRNWIQHINRMPLNRLPRVMKHYSPTGRRNHGRPLKWLLDMWDWNKSTSGPTPWQIKDDDVIHAWAWTTLRMCYTVTVKLCEIWGSHRGVADSLRLLGCDVLSLGMWFWMFWRHYEPIIPQNIRNYSPYTIASHLGSLESSVMEVICF